MRCDQQQRTARWDGIVRPEDCGVPDSMTSPVRTIRGSAPVAELVALMSGEGLRHIPVVDDDGRLQGIISRTELIAVLHRALIDATTGSAGPVTNT